MEKIVLGMVFCFLVFGGCKPPQLKVAEKAGLVHSRMYEKKWAPVIHSITNLDSVICEYLEKDKTIEICEKTYNNLSEAQKKKIVTTRKYCGGNIEFIDKDVEETSEEHPTRLLFNIYEKYFEHLEPGDLGLEITITKSSMDGSKDLYLLKKNGNGYSISYLIGTFGL
jgi:hypothetical protein